MTEEQRDNLLLAMSKNIENLSQKVEQYHKESLKNHEEALKNHEESLKNHEEALKNHEMIIKELERQRMNLAKMEFNLTEKIRALFDLSDIHNDKFKEHDISLKEIQETLDWHNRRILRLETIH